VLPWKESSEIRLQWTQKGQRFPRARGNRMMIGPRRESKFRRLGPIKNKRGLKEKFEMKFEKNNTEWALGGWDFPEEPGLGSPFEDLSLKDWWTRVWICAKTPTVWRRKERVLNGFGLETLSIYGQFRNKITFYPVIKGAYVNTKNCYMKDTDLWAEFGKRTPFGKKFSSKHSVKTPAVGSTSSFGRRAVSRLEEKTFGNTWWRGPSVKKEQIGAGH
jgi:hypothetical protein